MTVAHYLQILERSWKNQDGNKTAQFLSLRHDHAKFPNYQVEQAEGIVDKFLTSPLDELVCLHFKCLFYIGKQDFLEAYQAQSTLVQCFAKIMQVSNINTSFKKHFYDFSVRKGINIRLLYCMITLNIEGSKRFHIFENCIFFVYLQLNPMLEQRCTHQYV